MKIFWVPLLAVCLLGLALPVSAVEGPRAVLRTVGQYDTDGTVLYSVFVATRDEPLEQVLITAAIPKGTRFLEKVDIPNKSRYDGVADNIVWWSVPTVARDTLIGPFTFRVKLDGSTQDMPVSVPGALRYQSPADELLEDPGDNTKLLPLADSGSISFDQRGTLTSEGVAGLVPVGDTGILIYIPAGAVTREVTLTFKRLPVADDKLPQNAKDTWWCGLYQVTVVPQVEFTLPVAYAYPARRPITPGLPVNQFSSSDSADWKEVNPDPVKTTSGGERGLGFGGFGLGGCSTMPLNFTTCSTGFGCGFAFGGCQFGGGGFGGLGVNTAIRNEASVSGAVLTQQFGKVVRPDQLLISDGTSNIKDGTSNIIAILIGIR